MKNVILLFFLTIYTLSISAQTTGTWNKVVARDTFRLSGLSIAEIMYSIGATSKNNEIPTTKAVYHYVNGTIGSRPDSAWIKYNGSFSGKAPTDNLFRYGTTSLRSKDTVGILNVYAQAHSKPGFYMRYNDATSNGFNVLQLDPDNQTNNSTLSNWNIWLTNFSGVNSPYSTRANHVLRFCYNCNAGGGRILSTDGTIETAMESNYYRTVAGGGVKRILEGHLFQIVDTLGITHRMISIGGSHDGTVGDMGIKADLLSFESYGSVTPKAWMSFKYGQYLKGLTFLDTATLQFNFPQPGVDLIRARNAGNTADYSLLQLDGSNRVVFPKSAIDLYSFSSKWMFNSIGTITTADANPVQIGDATNKSFISIYAPSTEVLRLRSNTGGANLWQTYVNSDNIVWARPDGAAYLQAYAASAPQLILANSRMGVGGSPANTLDVYGTVRVRTLTGTATTVAGLNANGEVSGVTVGSGLSLSGNTLSATAGGVGGSGAANQVTYWNGTSTVTGSANYLFDGTSKVSLLASSAATTTDPSTNYRITGGSSWIQGIDNSDNDRFKISLRNALGTNDRFWMDTTGKAFFQHTGVFNSQNSNVAIIGSVPGSENFPGVWFGSATPSLSNYAFLADIGANKTILNAPSTGYVSIGVNNSEVMRVKSPGLAIATGAAPINALDVEGGAVIGASYAGTNTAPTNGLQVQGITMVGTSSSAGQFNVDGSGSTSATFSGVFRNSTSQVVLAARDDQRVGISTSAPNRTLEVSGEVRIADLTTDPPNKIVGSDVDGDLNAVTPSAEFSLTSGALNLAQQGATTGQVLEWTGSAWAPGTDDGGGVTDHGALTGLADDDHTQYLLLAGRTGGQIANGGTGAGDDITLRSTTNATKGDVILNDQGGNAILGGGELSGEFRFMEPSGSGANYTGFKSGAMSADQMYTLPTDVPADGDVWTWHTSGLTSWDPPATGGTNYQTFRDDGVAMAQRPAANFVSTSTVSAVLTDDNPTETEIALSVPDDGITATQIAPNAIGNSEMADDAINSAEIVDGGVGPADLNQMGALSTQALIWNGTSWAAQYILDDQNISDLSADVDNWNPTNWATSTTITVGGDATIRAITGFTALPGGTERTIVNTSSSAIYVPGLHPDSDLANRVVAPNDQIIPPYGGSITIVYSNNFSKWYVKSTTFNPANLGFSLPGLHFRQMPGSTNQSDHSFLGLAVSGTGAANSNANPTTSLPQSWELSTGTTATGAASVYLPKNANNFTAFGAAHISASAYVYMPALSSGTQRFITQFSLVGGANSTLTALNNAVGIRYSDNVNSGAWEFFTRNNAGTESTATTGVTVAANTLYLMTVTIDKARSEARCYLNGTMVARITTNLPNNVVCGTRFFQVATVGTTAKIANLAAISAWANY